MPLSRKTVSASYRACKAIFSSSVFKNGGLSTPTTSCIKRTSVHIKICVNQLCNRDFAMALRSREVSGTFEKRAPGNVSRKCPFYLPSTLLNIRNYIFRLTIFIQKGLVKDINVRQCQTMPTI